MRHQTRPSLLQIMICRLFGAKPLSETMLYHFNWTLKNKLLLNCIRNSSIFIRTSAFEYAFWEMWVKTSISWPMPIEDFGARSRYLRQGYVITSHIILWIAISYHCLRFLFLAPKSPIMIADDTILYVFCNEWNRAVNKWSPNYTMRLCSMGHRPKLDTRCAIMIYENSLSIYYFTQMVMIILMESLTSSLFPIYCNNVALHATEINNDLICHFMRSMQVKNVMNIIIWIELLIKIIWSFAYIFQVTRELDNKLSFTGYFRPTNHRQKFLAV